MAHDYMEHSWSESGKARGMLMLDIADQIERETEEQSARLYDMRIGEEMDVYELFGVEPVDDPLTSLRRHVENLNDTIENLRLELGEARDPAADVSMNAYDLLPQEDRDAVAWVRDHGGLDAVKRRWECLSYYADPVPRSYAERRIAARQRQIDESHAALRRRNARIAELNARVENQRSSLDGLVAVIDEMRPRLMPEGMEWPVYEDGEPVKFGDVVSDGDETGRVYYVTFDTVNPVIIGFTDETPDQDPGTWLEVSVSDGERVKRPATKVLDADGVEIDVGDDLYSVEGSLKFHVSHVDRINGKIATDAMFSLDKWADPKMYTHRAPVLAADGRPLREGETVYHVADGRACVVREVREGGAVVEPEDGRPCGRCRADYLTHERPDSWERLWMDMHPADETECVGLDRDEFVRRAKALAERGR